MTESNEHAIRILNDLIASARDGEEGFGKAAKGVHSDELRDLFTEQIVQWGKWAAELEGAVRNLGGEPDTMGHYGAILDRGWVDLEQRIRPKDDPEFLSNCQRGAESSLKHYLGALGKELPAVARAIVDRQARQIEQTLTRLQNLERARRAG
jgi:uncharacterized protein (TIGR02284 family)